MSRHNLSSSVLNDLLCGFILEYCFETFKDRELSRLPCSLCGKFCHQYIFKAGHDIYGQRIDNGDANGELVECPHCGKSLAAARFAPHLEKCMGIGRTSRTSKRTSAAPSATTTIKKSVGVGRNIVNPVSTPSSASDSMDDTTSSATQAKRRKTRLNPNEAVSTLDTAMLLDTPSIPEFQ